MPRDKLVDLELVARIESEALFGGDRTSPVMQARLRTWPGDDFRLIATSDGHVTHVDYCGAAT